jgi:DNA-directed RNA polymerase II subunit RPB4
MTTQRKLIRGQQKEELDASKLQLGPDFQHAQPLTMSEANAVIRAIRDHRRQQNRGEEPPMTEVMRKTLNYVDAFTKYRDDDQTHAIDRILSSADMLHPFERAQLGSLGLEEAEEAKTLIPSLATKIEDDQLQQLLDELSALRKYA